MRLRIVFLIAFLTGCAPAGEWADDPRNFTRAWDTPCPEGVVVLHSWYWRSWHFTREEVLFFQFRANSAFRDRFIQSNAFVPVAPAAVFSRGYCRTTPSWFLPGAPSRYRAWSVPPHSTREGSPPFIAEDLNTGVLFVYACQI
mgnify:CR=1 FL=1